METLVKRNGSFPIRSIFDDFFPKDIFDWTDRNFSALGSNLPSVNLKETDRKLEVELAAPGMKKEDFKVEIDNGMLTISCENETTHEDSKEGNYIRREFNYQKFYRTLHLPDSIDEDKIEASYHDGILKIEIDKKEGSQAKTTRIIDIK
jgi:HSP20 family protein